MYNRKITPKQISAYQNLEMRIMIRRSIYDLERLYRVTKDNRCIRILETLKMFEKLFSDGAIIKNPTRPVPNLALLPAGNGLAENIRYGNI